MPQAEASTDGGLAAIIEREDEVFDSLTWKPASASRNCVAQLAVGKDKMNLIGQARDFARAAHDGQVRKGLAREPYAVHLEEVARSVAELGGTDAMIAAAWLHDTVEDCGVTPAELAARFGEAVAALVAELTDDKALEKAERKRLQLVNAPRKSLGAALVKLCDKMSNVRAVADSPATHWDPARQNAYVDWAEAVVALLPSGADVGRAAFAKSVARARSAVAGRVVVSSTPSERRT